MRVLYRFPHCLHCCTQTRISHSLLTLSLSCSPLVLQFHQKSTNQRNIFLSLRKGVTTSAQGVGQGTILLLDTVPLLKRILSPQLRSVAVQLLSQKWVGRGYLYVFVYNYVFLYGYLYVCLSIYLIYTTIILYTYLYIYHLSIFL